VQVAPGLVAGAPGADAQVPAAARLGAVVADPSGTGGAAAAPLATAGVQLDACLAAAVLSGHAIQGCDAPADSPRALVDSLNTVGACAQLAIASARPVDVCSSPAAAGPLGADAVANLVSDAQLCPAARLLGLLGAGRCSGVAATSTAGAAAGGTNAGGTSQLCLGLAVLTGGQAARCTEGAPNGGNPGANPGPQAGARSPSVGIEGAGSGVRDASLAGTAAAAVTGDPGDLATTGVELAALVLAALGLVVIGFGGTRVTRRLA
jgi:hypothetical protein